MAGTWVTFGALTDLIGEDRARCFCRNRGGLRTYIPVMATRGHWLEALIGPVAMTALCAAYGGEVIMTSNMRRGGPLRPSIEKLLKEGKSLRETAKLLDVTERYVEQVASRVRSKMQQKALWEVKN